MAEWLRAPGTALVAVGIGVFVWANVWGGRWGWGAEDRVELVGVLIACAGWVVNIWSRLRTRRQLQDQASELVLLADQTPANVWTTDRELRLTSVFGSLIKRLENPELRVPGRTLYDIFGTRDETHPAIAAHLRALRGESAAYERAAGDVFLEGRVEPLRDEGERVIGCVGAVMDVSTWRWAESQVRRFAALVESSGDAIITTTLDGTIETWNRGAERLYGFAAAEAIGKSVAIVMPPDRKAEMDRNRAAALRGESTGTHESERVRKDGTPIAVSVTVSPIRDARGAIVGTSGIARDITERKRAEAALHQYQERFELATLATNQAVWEQNFATQEVWWSPVLGALLGYAPREVEGSVSWWRERIHPEDRERVIAGSQRVIGGGGRYWADEYRLRRGDGRYARVLDRGYVVRDEAGRPLRMIGSLSDVTERRQTEEALRESERRFRTVLDRMRLIGLGLDMKGRVNYCNDYLVEITGWSRGEVFGANWFSTFVSPSQPVNAMFALAMETGELPAHYVNDILTRDGGRRTICWNNTLLHDTAGRVAGIVSIGEDITESALAEAELRRSREELRALARHLNTVREEEDTRMSREIHDQLGQALTALRLDLSWLARKVPEASAPTRQKIGAMVALADETIEAVRRIAAELRPPILDDLGLVAALEWYVAHFARRTGLRHELEVGAKELVADRDLSVVAYRIVQEALTNVARHARAKRVLVRVDETDGMLVLEIHDDGLGIPEAAARSSDSLGIAGMRERAAARGGTLQVGRAPEGGTSVRVTIPLERRQEPRESA